MLLADLPSTRHQPASSKPVKRRAAAPFYRVRRRTFVKAMILAGSGLTLNLLGKVPVARATHVGTDGYEIDPFTDSTHTTTCLQTSFYTSNSGCDFCGPSTSYPDVCITPAIDPHKTGYHRNTGLDYQLRKNVCSHQVGSVDYDGWLWTVASCCWVCQGGSNCGSYQNATTRCHDGKKCNAQGGSCSNSICEWRTGGTSGCPG
ncbi:hypothetical protein BH18ACT6_BH18ACT6_11930 [soil metagenome]